jgi:outer membrane lipoprotein-sorting protein
MTGALRLRVALLCVILACGTAMAQQPGGEQAWNLGALMQELARVQHSNARFVERKYLKILDRPLELSGTLEYRAPDHLARRTLTPKPESFVVDGERLKLEDARGRKRTFALQDHPVLWAFVESIRSTLKGDQAQLERFYDVVLEGDQRAWRLLLTPKQPRMSALIARIGIAGSGGRIATVEIHEAQGDRSVMTITEAEP